MWLLLMWLLLAPAIPGPQLTPVPDVVPSPSPSPSPTPTPSPPPPQYGFISQFDRPAHIPAAHLPWRVGTDWAQAELQAGLRLWNEAGQGELFVFSPDRAACDVWIDWKGTGLPPGKVSATWWDAGLGYRQVTGITLAVDGLPRGNQVQLVAHELGHALGLDHSADPRDIMAERMHTRRYRSADDVRLTERDRAALDWLYHQSNYVPIRGGRG